MTRLQQAGIVPKKHILDKEVSEAMKAIIKDEYKMAMELVPPGCHRRNAAEVAIRNFKAHFLSVLAGAAEDFPPSLWDCLLPQTEITLNLLRQSNATPKVSAYAHLCGPFDYQDAPCTNGMRSTEYRCMKRQTSGAHGRTTLSTDGIYQLPPNIIARTDVTLKQPKVNGSRTQSTSVTKISRDQPSPMQIRS
jgi:hypothetical protein